MATRATIAGFVTLLVLGSSPLARAQVEEPAPVAASEGVASTARPLINPKAPVYGVGARMRWITIPGWFLNMFTKANKPLSSYGFGGEFFRRKVDRDDPMRTWEISFGLGYQKMGPPDGNWLGNGKDAREDTDWVQFRNFGLVTFDAAFIARQYFNNVFGIHYGAGLGLGVVTGEILRTSSDGCTDDNLGNTKQCKPRVCSDAAHCEAALAKTEGPANDDPSDPHRFVEDSVPGAIPVLNLVFGLDFKVPQAPGLEFRLEGGFFDAFFMGGTVAYAF